MKTLYDFTRFSVVFITNFEHLNNGWECCVCISKIAIKVTRKPDKDKFVFTVVYWSIPRRAKNKFGNL